MLWKISGQKKKIRLQTLQLTSQLSRWCQIREDLYYAFGKCLESGLESPVREYVETFLARINGGMSTDLALDLMQKQVNEDHFYDLVAAIRFNLRFRGNLPSLFEHLELQMFKIEEEYSRRRISTAHDRNLAALLILSGPVVWLIRFGTSPETRRLFIDTDIGRILLLLSLLCTLGALAAFIFVLKRINS